MTDALHFEDRKEASKKRRKKNRETSLKILTEVDVMINEKNDGAHLIVKTPRGGSIIDFWPGTGLYIVRKSGLRGRGVRNLIKEINK